MRPTLPIVILSLSGCSGSCIWRDGVAFLDLQSALSSGLAGPVDVCRGVHSGTAAVVTQDVEIRGLGPAELVILEGDGANPVIEVLGADLTLRDLTITGGYSNGSGAGLAATEATGVFIADSVFRGNLSESASASAQGGGAAIGTSSRIERTLFEDNAVQGTAWVTWGGGLYLSGAAIHELEDVTIRSNVASNGYGGGLAVHGSATVTGLGATAIEGNTAELGGGGLEVASAAAVSGLDVVGNDADLGGGVYLSGTLTDSWIEGNTAGRGGGLGVASGSPVLDGVEIRGNHATESGGGAWLSQHLESSQVTIDGNTTDGSGGGIFGDDQLGVLVGPTTVSGNHAVDSGGGIYAAFQTELWDVAVVGNSADADGGGLALAGHYQVELYDVTVDGNTAVGDGGGVFLEREDLLVTTSSGYSQSDSWVWAERTWIVGNSATGAGGGLYQTGSSSSPEGLWQLGGFEGNDATAGGGVYVDAAGFETIDVDFGSGVDANLPNDIEVGAGMSYSALGPAADVTCDPSGC